MTPSFTEIRDQLDIASDIIDDSIALDTVDTYEQGVIAALEWVLGISQNKPMIEP